MSNEVHRRLLNLTNQLTANETGDEGGADVAPHDTRPASLSTVIYTYGVPALWLICLISVLANGYIVIAAFKCHNCVKQTPHVLFTVSLMISNILLSITQASGLVTQSFLPTVMGVQVSLCVGLAHEVIRLSLLITCVLHLLALATHQFLGTIRPLHYASVVTLDRVRRVCVLLWLLPICTFLCFTFAVPGQAFRSPHCANVNFFTEFSFRLAIVLVIVGPMLIMCGLYCCIVLLVKRRRKPSLATERLSQTKARTSLERRRQRTTLRTLTTTCMYMLSFVFGFGLSLSLFILVCTDCAFDRSVIAANQAAFTIVYFVALVTMILKPLLDAFIYAIRNDELRLSIYILNLMLFNCTSMIQRIESENLHRRSSQHQSSVVGGAHSRGSQVFSSIHLGGSNRHSTIALIGSARRARPSTAGCLTTAGGDIPAVANGHSGQIELRTYGSQQMQRVSP